MKTLSRLRSAARWSLAAVFGASLFLVSPPGLAHAAAAPAVTPVPPVPPGPAAPAAPPASPVPPGERWEGAPPTPDKDECQETATNDPALDAALLALTVETEGGRRPLHDLKIVGLKTLGEEAVWEAIGGRPPHIDGSVAAVVVRRLAGLGIGTITPVIDTRGSEGPILVLNVLEHPTVRKVVIEGLGELNPESLLSALLQVPSRKDSKRASKRWKPWPGPREPGAVPAPKDESAEDRKRHTEEEVKQAIEEVGVRRAITDAVLAEMRRHDNPDAPRCPDPLPVREWLARSEGEVVFPGIAWKGLTGGLDRVMGRIFDKGYEMASLTAELDAAGTLTLRISEGRVQSVVVAGVAPEIEGRVRALVTSQVGKPFVKSDLDETSRQVERRFPFLRGDSQKRNSRRRPRVVQKPATSPTTIWQSEEAKPHTQRRWYTIDGGTLTLSFKARRYTERSGSPAELIRHTQITGFAPGIEGGVQVWDKADRVHLRLLGAANVNTRRARQAQAPVTPAPGVPTPPAFAADSWRFDWMTGASLAVPMLRLAELGVQVHSRVDTSDRWRMNRVDSYLNSLVFNRPDSEYFHRQGVSAFATFHVAERITAGIEYRRDRYTSLAPAADHFTFFNRDEVPVGNPLIDDGRLGSLLLRLEYSSLRAPLHMVGGHRRDPERSIVERPGGRQAWTELRTVNTLELSRPGLGGDEGTGFVRLVSDSVLFLQTSGDSGLKLRFRAAGKLGGDRLPRQKEEALGGWTAVRGYDFKEQRGGDFSLLGTAEYRFHFLSLFVDAGSLRTPGGDFGDPLTGLGAALNFSDKVHLDFAWRTDGEARARPSVRFFFRRTY